MDRAELYREIYAIQKEAMRQAIKEAIQEIFQEQKDSFIPEEVSQNQAYRIYSRNRVEKWKEQGLQPCRSNEGRNAKKWYRREDLLRHALKDNF